MARPDTEHWLKIRDEDTRRMSLGVFNDGSALLVIEDARGLESTFVLEPAQANLFRDFVLNNMRWRPPNEYR